MVSTSLRILVVDDEPMIRQILERMLGEHRVVTVATVDEGLELLGRDPFDLVLCDLMLPDRTGADMHAEVASRWPALADRLVVMSGGAYTPSLQAFLDQPVVARLDKPLSLASLRAVVQRIVALGATAA